MNSKSNKYGDEKEALCMGNWGTDPWEERRKAFCRAGCLSQIYYLICSYISNKGATPLLLTHRDVGERS